MRISLIGTGGTIASRESADGVVASASARELLGMVPSGALPSGVDVRPVDVRSRTSFAFTLDDMRAIARAALDEARRGADAVVITHGTDSVEETSFLMDLLHDGEQPIVFTGAQRNLSMPDTDATDNLSHALRVAADPAMRGRGVLVTFSGRTFPARGVRKVHTSELAAFGNLVAGDVTKATAPQRRSTLDGREHVLRNELPRVDVIACQPGGDGRTIRAVADAGTDGLVIQALGVGNTAPEDTAAVGYAASRGIPVVVTTRALAGAVAPVYGAGGGADLARAGAVFGGQLSPWQARILLACVLARRGADPAGDVLDWLRRTDI